MSQKPPQPVRRGVGDLVFQTILDLHNAGRVATRPVVVSMTGQSYSVVDDHVKRMLEDGSIEVADMQERRGTNIYWYRAVEIPEYSQEEAEALTVTERQNIAGWVVQSGLAEVVAALWKGNLADPRTILSWDWYNVDARGRDDLDAENVRHLKRLREIECESINRVAKSHEETTPLLVSLSAFVRARRPRRPGRSQNREPRQQTN